MTSEFWNWILHDFTKFYLFWRLLTSANPHFFLYRCGAKSGHGVPRESANNFQVVERCGRHGTMWYPLVAGWFILYYFVENSTQTMMIAGVPHDLGNLHLGTGM